MFKALTGYFQPAPAKTTTTPAAPAPSSTGTTSTAASSSAASASSSAAAAAAATPAPSRNATRSGLFSAAVNKGLLIDGTEVPEELEAYTIKVNKRKFNAGEPNPFFINIPTTSRTIVEGNATNPPKFADEEVTERRRFYGANAANAYKKASTYKKNSQRMENRNLNTKVKAWQAATLKGVREQQKTAKAQVAASAKELELQKAQMKTLSTTLAKALGEYDLALAGVKPGRLYGTEKMTNQEKVKRQANLSAQITNVRGKLEGLVAATQIPSNSGLVRNATNLVGKATAKVPAPVAATASGAASASGTTRANKAAAWRRVANSARQTMAGVQKAATTQQQKAASQEAAIMAQFSTTNPMIGRRAKNVGNARKLAKAATGTGAATGTATGAAAASAAGVGLTQQQNATIQRAIAATTRDLDPAATAEAERQLALLGKSTGTPPTANVPPPTGAAAPPPPIQVPVAENVGNVATPPPSPTQGGRRGKSRRARSAKRKARKSMKTSRRH